jgi:hypothetical protein
VKSRNHFLGQRRCRWSYAARVRALTRRWKSLGVALALVSRHPRWPTLRSPRVRRRKLLPWGRSSTSRASPAPAYASTSRPLLGSLALEPGCSSACTVGATPAIFLGRPGSWRAGELFTIGSDRLAARCCRVVVRASRASTLSRYALDEAHRRADAVFATNRLTERARSLPHRLVREHFFHGRRQPSAVELLMRPRLGRDTESLH